jgi:hypothetical protein
MNIRITRSVTFAAVVGAIGFPGGVYAQRYTIPELAAARPDEKIVAISTLTEERVVPLADLASKADVVIDARLVAPHSYLSEDKKKIYTDYEIVPSRVVRSQIGDMSTSKVPGSHAPARLTIAGGQISLGDQTIISTLSRMKSIKVGGRYLIFLSRLNQTDNRFTPTQGSAGLFEVRENNRLDPLLKTSAPNPDFRDAVVDDVVRKAQAAPGRQG